MRSLLQPRRVSIGPLEAIEFPASPEAPVIVCMHGYGADAADLAPLAMELELSGPARWVFPEAPLDLGFGGRGWYLIDHVERERLARAGGAIDLSSMRPPGFDEAVESVEAFLAALKVPWERLILGGFSQGAMMAVDATLRAPSSPRGLFILSGTLVDEPGLRKSAPSRAGLTYFQSHGTMDSLLGHEAAKRLHSALEAAGWKGRFFEFPGGHSLPREALQGLTDYLNTLLIKA